MTDRPNTVRQLPLAVVHDCWNRIGVRGDRSCPELEQHIHCRNCPVYSAGAAELLDGDPPPDYLAERTTHFAQPAHIVGVQRRSVVVFRVASEWLSLATSVVAEVANLLPIHSLPHRQNGVVLGLASVRGELLVCLSLGQVLGVESLPPAPREPRSTVYQRLLVIRRDAVRVVCPVDEVHGIHHFQQRDLKEVPTTVARATVAYSTALLSWRGRSVGVLDDELVFYTLARSLG
ncbi:MAG: chemotaxis protein [Acidobacteria bacterium]|nr:MAG: chemotaxis protein [Acidobacteriota bacterium]PYR23359.1 MAG: chemotaxis protein [Acidobacteriota bacterium]PYR45384.1 MAG: chemotaxis protein [Acidobacteriota bacterium]